MLNSYRLASPKLDWSPEGAPISSEFDDVYFDKESGLEETRYVFIKHNRLIERWSSMTQRHFVIAETGFGTGLNFLCAIQGFLDCAPKDKQLHFISVEKFPMSKDALHSALKMWPSLTSFSEELIAVYPEACHGLHRLSLANGRIQLSLWFGEAEQGFASLDADVDAWFLDGFAPSKNPEMWSEKLFHHIHRLSHQGTTFATFTAAGIVRRGLQQVGFDVRKVKGFGHKREMAIGQLEKTSKTLSERMSQGQAWFNVRQDSPAQIGRVLVVGSGLSGAHTAFALAQQGIEVTVWEQEDVIAKHASGNPQGMLYPKLAAEDTPLNRFYLSGFLQAAAMYQTLDPDGEFWRQSGLLQIPKNAKEAQRFEKLLTAKLYPETVLTASKQKPGSLHLPLSGWVAPQALCEHLLSHDKIHVQLNCKLQSISKVQEENTQDKVWQVSNGKEKHFFSHVVICTANQTHQLKDLPDNPAYAIRGQVANMPLEAAEQACIKATGNTQALDFKQVLCEFGYVSPALKGKLHFGSTYDLNDTDTDVRPEGHERNLKILESLLALPDNTFNVSDCQGRTAFRCAVPDYTPIVGPIQSDIQYRQTFEPLSKNAKWQSNQIAEPASQLYLNIGHGSRGLVSTPLSGQYIASLILSTPSPLEQNISRILHPSRFLIRNLKRGQ
ncbi:bifunctional tRNA (5-methylaminomethyl-2-thiouridine)(34)-methyltransferase MnmD/FAD-dependent 5-carboxymethylaminomethyl-2-thiouridine(34) oxidoreductase MnmC [Marinomonas sp. THO17]|uniref:bifunctional tRNA (5-methylaminomethyl-2-thiouridine)(34)-methyltransferase MnmD/FAD-dependent 5-carboxymethylaminomethyl-2-thiouridine(34) oxidoreductase MnmC n=1 Tax=Marinomonas sp. THO17 TaxID=3149048 RepID=UPI00336BBB99